MATTTHQYTYTYTETGPKSYIAISFLFNLMLYGPSVQQEKCPGASQKSSFRLLFFSPTIREGKKENRHHKNQIRSSVSSHM